MTAFISGVSGWIPPMENTPVSSKLSFSLAAYWFMLLVLTGFVTTGRMTDTSIPALSIESLRPDTVPSV